MINANEIGEGWGFCALAPDGKTLAVAGAREINLWDIPGGKRLPAITERNDYQPLALAFSPDSQTLAATMPLGRIILWDAAQKSPRQVFPAHDRGIISVAVSPDGKTAYTGGNDGDIREWVLATGKPLRRLRHPEGKAWLIPCLQCAPDGQTLATSYFAGISIWNLPQGVLVRDIPAPLNKGRIASMALSPSGNRVVWQSIDDGDLPLWDLKAGQEIRRFPQGTGGTYYLAYAPTGETIASVITSKLCLWEVETGQALYEKPLSAHCITYSPDGLLLALYSDPIRILEAATGEEVLRIPCRSRHGGSWSLAFSPSGRHLAITELNAVGIWDLQARQYLHTFSGHRSRTTSLAFTPDGQRLLSGAEDTTAVVWDMNAVPAGKPPVPDWPSLWDDLKAPNRLRAYQAFQHLRQAAQKAVELLATHLQPVPAMDPQRLEQLLRDLDNPNFVRREKATTELTRWSDQAEKKLRDLHDRTGSVEVRQRLEQILSKVGTGLATRRLLWSVRLLEMSGTPEARALLRRLAQGAPEALVTRQVQRALGRLERKPGKG